MIATATIYLRRTIAATLQVSQNNRLKESYTRTPLFETIQYYIGIQCNTNAFFEWLHQQTCLNGEKMVAIKTPAAERNVLTELCRLVRSWN